MDLTEKLAKRLSEILERDLTKVEAAILDWTIVQVTTQTLLDLQEEN